MAIKLKTPTQSGAFDALDIYHGENRKALLCKPCTPRTLAPWSKTAELQGSSLWVSVQSFQLQFFRPVATWPWHQPTSSFDILFVHILKRNVPFQLLSIPWGRAWEKTRWRWPWRVVSQNLEGASVITDKMLRVMLENNCLYMRLDKNAMWKYIAEDKTFEQQVVKESHPLDCWASVDAQFKMHVLTLNIYPLVPGYLKNAVPNGQQNWSNLGVFIRPLISGWMILRHSQARACKPRSIGLYQHHKSQRCLEFFWRYNLYPVYSSWKTMYLLVTCHSYGKFTY